MARTLLMVASLAFAFLCAYPQNPDPGLIRVWGDGHMADVLLSLENGFRKHHPDIRFENKLMGTGTAMAGLYTSVADLAFMGRAATPKEIMAFEWVFRYKPQSIEMMTGSLNVPGKSPALAVFVHKDNPLPQLTLAQLDGIFGCERRRGLGNIQTWGQLGLKGEWQTQAIHAYSHDAETGSGAFFRQTVMNDSRKWNWDAVKEFQDSKKPDGSTYEASQQILDAVSRDLHGIGVSCLCYENPLVKPIALAFEEGDGYWQATTGNLVRRRYPLTRLISVYVNRANGRPIEPKVKEFLRYILSREGQESVARDGGYLPLAPEAVGEQLRQLD
jgi:phosphate transport system substrate-binding protein